MQNNQRYWLRGGVMGIIVGLISIWLTLKNGSPTIEFINDFINYTKMFEGMGEGSLLLQLGLNMLVDFFIFIILGIIIGYIYEKIKNRNKTS